jgi:hypothetical protein
MAIGHLETASISVNSKTEFNFEVRCCVSALAWDVKMRKNKVTGLGLLEQNPTPPKTPYRRKAWLKASERHNNPNLAPEAVPTNKFWVPESHVKLRDIFDLIGIRYLPGWTGNERSARKVDAEPDPPWFWLPTGIIPESRYQIFSDECEIVLASKEQAWNWWAGIKPVLYAEWQEEKSAYERQTACFEKMRNLLAAGDLETEILLGTSGEFVSVPERVWRSNKGFRFLRAGHAVFRQTGGLEPSEVDGVVLVRTDQLEKMKSVPTEATVELPESTDVDATRFPYLVLMLEAAKSELFEAEERVRTETIVGWLSDNWPRGLGGKSPTKFSNMATLLRRPEDEKGGQTKGKVRMIK